MDKFKLTNVLLYAKGWYRKSDDIWADLKNILKLDDYEPFSKNDVFNIIVRNYEKFIFKGKLTDFLKEIEVNEVWKCGYYTKECNWTFNLNKDTLPNYDYQTAIIYKILSDLRFIENMDNRCIIRPPKYSKANPRPKEIELKTVIEIFNKKP